MSDLHNAFYDLPIVQHGEIDSFEPRSSSLAIHEVLHDRLTIPAMIRMDQGDHLTVICHGAIDRKLIQLPFFQRVTSTLERPGPFVLFSDPVLALDPNLRLAWFAGTAETEIVPTMLAMVRRVCNIMGIERVSFQGSSGGGFASLQLSARWPGSLAYVWSPQTDAMRFYKSHIREYLAVAFPGMIKEEAIAQFPERLSCIESYQRQPLSNFIYYAQNTQDDMHVANHFRPFMQSLGAGTKSGLYLDGRVQVAMVDQGPGHSGPSQAGWDRHLEQAMAMHSRISWQSAPSMPSRMNTARKDHVLLTKTSSSTARQFSDKLQVALETAGIAAAEALIRENEASHWSTLAAAFEDRDRELAWECAGRAFAVAPRRYKRQYGRRLFGLACRLRIRTYPPEALKLLSTSPDPVEAERATRLLQRSATWEKLAKHGFPMPVRAKHPAYQPIPGKVLLYLESPASGDVRRDVPGYPGLLASLDRYGVAITTAFKSAPTGGDDDPEGDFQRAAVELESIARRERPEVIHAASSYLAGIPAVAVGRRLGVPVVFHLQCGATERSDDDLDWYLSTAYDAALRLEITSAELAEAVVCSTESLKDVLTAGGVAADKITVVPPSVDLRRIQSRKQQRKRPAGDAVVLGVFGPGDKQQRDLLHVAAILIDQGLDLRIVLIGDTTLNKHTRQTINELELGDQITQLDESTLTDNSDIYEQIDIAVLPSTAPIALHSIGQGHLLELMARAKTIVVAGGMYSTDLNVDNVSGVISSPATIDGLLKALGPVTQDQAFRAHLGARAHSWVVANRSADQAAASLRTIYRALPVGDRLPALTRPERHDERLWWKLMKPLERKRQASILDYAWRGQILDLGTRNGIIAAQIALTQAPEFIVGIDPDAEALADAQQIVDSNQITSSPVEFVVAIGEVLPFADRVFDGVIITQVLEHVDHPEIVLKEIVRVLKPNGSVLVGVPGYGTMPPGTTVGHVQDFTVAAMTQLIQDSGLELVEQRTVDVREYHFARLPDEGQSG